MSATDEDTETITVNIKAEDGTTVPFEIKTSSPLEELMHAYYALPSVDRNSTWFYLGERFLNEEDTPDDVGLQDGSEIEVRNDFWVGYRSPVLKSMEALVMFKDGIMKIIGEDGIEVCRTPPPYPPVHGRETSEWMRVCLDNLHRTAADFLRPDGSEDAATAAQPKPDGSEDDTTAAQPKPDGSEDAATAQVKPDGSGSESGQVAQHGSVSSG